MFVFIIWLSKKGSAFVCTYSIMLHTQWKRSLWSYRKILYKNAFTIRVYVCKLIYCRKCSFYQNKIFTYDPVGMRVWYRTLLTWKVQPFYFRILCIFSRVFQTQCEYFSKVEKTTYKQLRSVWRTLLNLYNSFYVIFCKHFTRV